MQINIQKEVEIEKTHRTELLEAMFEIPAKTKLSVHLTGELPNDLLSPNRHSNGSWNIGLIVGPSGSGKTLLLNELFGPPEELTWEKRSVVDDFDDNISMESISDVCASVGFNTIPSWLRPYSVLSNGERFRVSTARSLLGPSPIRIDEFTSVVDRQVAQFASYAIQRYVRKAGKRLIVASCHYDIIDWLQPDWLLEPGNPCRFTWRSLQPRPSITVAVSRVKYETWNLFKDYHYMSQDLNKAARCYGLYVSTSGLEIQLNNEGIYPPLDRGSNNREDGSGPRIPSDLSENRVRNSSLVFSENTSAKNQCSDKSNISTTENKTTSKSKSDAESLDRCPKIRDFVLEDILGESRRTYRIASLCGVLYRPHPKVSDIRGFTRMVTLPDFQGLGLAFVLACQVASAYKALGKRLHSYPNHPAWIRSYQRSRLWMQVKDSGSYSPRRGTTSTVGGFGNKRCAVFCYIGDAMNREEAERLINGN